MKSQVYKIRNLRIAENLQPRTIRVKPMGALFVLLFTGIFMMFFGDNWATGGLILLLLSLFGLAFMPDRVLVQFYPDYMLMYNQKDRLSCMVIYYDEIVQWQYEYGRSWDALRISLSDGSDETIEMYGRRMISRLMNAYAPGKEVRSVRIKED